MFRPSADPPPDEDAEREQEQARILSFSRRQGMLKSHGRLLMWLGASETCSGWGVFNLSVQSHLLLLGLRVSFSVSTPKLLHMSSTNNEGACLHNDSL